MAFNTEPLGHTAVSSTLFPRRQFQYAFCNKRFSVTQNRINVSEKTARKQYDTRN